MIGRRQWTGGRPPETMSGGTTPFRTEQGRVAAGMGAAIATSLSVPVLLAWVHPFNLPDLSEPTARLAYAVRWEGPVLACLGLAVANVARLRFFSAADIGGSAGSAVSPEVGRARAVLQNTLEQAVFAFGSHCALAVQVSPRWAPVLPGLVGLFCTGRALFWLGYRHGAAARAFGFGLTFYPSFGACLAATALLFC